MGMQIAAAVASSTALLLQLLLSFRSSSSAAAIAAAAVVTGIIFVVGSNYKRSSGGKGKDDDEAGATVYVLPPGNQGLPFVGETLKLIAAYKTENPEPFIDERVKRNNSRLFTSHVFGETTVFSADPRFNRLVVCGEGKTFEGSYPSSISTLLGRHSLVLMKGSLHKRMHSLTLTRFSSLSVLRHSLLPDIDRLVRVTLDSWLLLLGPEEPEGVTRSMPSRRLLLLDQAKKITFELTVKQLMSYDPGEWTESLRREYLLLIDGFFSIPFPFPSLLPFTTYGRAIQVKFAVPGPQLLFLLLLPSSSLISYFINWPSYIIHSFL